MNKRDYYEVLDIEKGASESDIKKSYRKMAMQYHPDRNQHDHDAEERFKEASEAYEVLSDPQRRQIYDVYGHQGLDRQGFHGFDNVDDIFSSMGGIFEEFFGGMGGFGFSSGRSSRSRAARGMDLQHEVTISFHESAKGIEKEVKVAMETACDTCAGSGQAPGSDRVVCKTCGGSGQITQRQGFFVMSSACPSCHGEGSKIEKPCDDCRGIGRVRKNKKLKVKVPAGVENGMRLILRGQGGAGERGGPAGDLHVFIRVETHDFFERHEEHLYCRIPISFPQAALGDKIKVPTLDGEKEIEIKPGTETGEQIRLRGKGFINLHNNGLAGDEVIEFFVKTPKKLSKKQKELLKQFQNS